VGHIFIPYPCVPGRQQKLYGGPAVPDRVREPQAIHASGKVDVRKHNPDILSRFEQRNCFIGTPGFKRVKPCFLQKGYCMYAQQELIFNNKNQWQRHRNNKRWFSSVTQGRQAERLSRPTSPLTIGSDAVGTNFPKIMRHMWAQMVNEKLNVTAVRRRAGRRAPARRSASTAVRLAYLLSEYATRPATISAAVRGGGARQGTAATYLLCLGNRACIRFCGS
jgi:hypothetical protein